MSVPHESVIAALYKVEFKCCPGTHASALITEHEGRGKICQLKVDRLHYCSSCSACQCVACVLLWPTMPVLRSRNCLHDKLTLPAEKHFTT